MRLLLKWLRPKTVPSPNRKRIPFGKRVRLSLYRSCLRTLRKWYQKYAFSDRITLSGKPSVKLCHEHRDTAFEAEIKRLRLSLSEGMLERNGASSSQPEKRKRQPYYRCFHFVDHLLLEVDGQKVSIDHGDGRSFVSTLNGRLKESDAATLVAKYAFSGSRREDKPSSPSSRPKSVSLPRKPGGLFGDDPLFGKTPKKPEVPVSQPTPTIKNVEGVTIDESF